MNGKVKSLLRCAAAVVIGGVIAVMIARGRVAAVAAVAAPGQNQVLWRLSDGLFVSGLLMTGLGALTWVSTTGFFDIFGFAFSSVLTLFSPLRAPEKQKKFYEYKLEKEGKRKPGLLFILVAGLILLAAALACYLMI